MKPIVLQKYEYDNNFLNVVQKCRGITGLLTFCQNDVIIETFESRLGWTAAADVVRGLQGPQRHGVPAPHYTLKLN